MEYATWINKKESEHTLSKYGNIESISIQQINKKVKKENNFNKNNPNNNTGYFEK